MTSIANALVLAFPILLLCVPKGAGIFLAGILALALLAHRGMGDTWVRYRATLCPLGLAILAAVVVFMTSKLYFGVPWNVMDNPSRILLRALASLPGEPGRAAQPASIIFQAGIVGLLLGLAALQARHPRAGGVENL